MLGQSMLRCIYILVEECYVMLGESMLRCIYILVEECYVMLGESMLRCIYWWRNATLCLGKACLGVYTGGGMLRYAWGNHA